MTDFRQFEITDCMDQDSESTSFAKLTTGAAFFMRSLRSKKWLERIETAAVIFPTARRFQRGVTSDQKMRAFQDFTTQSISPVTSSAHKPDRYRRLKNFCTVIFPISARRRPQCQKPHSIDWAHFNLTPLGPLPLLRTAT